MHFHEAFSRPTILIIWLVVLSKIIEQFLFFSCFPMQGLFIFVFHCVFDQQVCDFIVGFQFNT